MKNKKLLFITLLSGVLLTGCGQQNASNSQSPSSQSSTSTDYFAIAGSYAEKNLASPAETDDYLVNNQHLSNDQAEDIIGDMDRRIWVKNVNTLIEKYQNRNENMTEDQIMSKLINDHKFTNEEARQGDYNSHGGFELN